MGFHLSSKKIPGFSLGISLEFSASFFRAEKTIFLAVLGLPVVFRSGKWKFNQLENPSEKKRKTQTLAPNSCDKCSCHKLGKTP